MGDRATVMTRPLAYRVDDAAALLGIGKSKVWELIGSGRLKARRIDGATIILHSELELFLSDTPLVELKNSAHASIK
jgi:excisionase family DNA binding protein